MTGLSESEQHTGMAGQMRRLMREEESGMRIDFLDLQLAPSDWQLSANAAPSLFFPATLRTLWLALRDATSTGDADFVLLARHVVSSLPQLTCLFLQPTSSEGRHVPVSAAVLRELLLARELTSLRTHIDSTNEESFRLLHRMKQLQELSTGEMLTAEAIRWINDGSVLSKSDPASKGNEPLSLQSIEFLGGVDSLIAAELLRIPTLTSLKPIWSISLSALQMLLPALPLLKHLQANGPREEKEDPLKVVAAIQGSMPLLHSLHLSDYDLASKHLQTLLSHARCLESLTLRDCYHFRDLSCFSVPSSLPSLVHSLRILRISGPLNGSMLFFARDILSLRGLEQLRELQVSPCEVGIITVEEARRWVGEHAPTAADEGKEAEQITAPPLLDGREPAAELPAAAASSSPAKLRWPALEYVRILLAPEGIFRPGWAQDQLTNEL